ncbi:MAG TPA: alanine racemase [Acidimicrobiales bacterium]|nr:alanine racemase [Acidimicrobiales bacterium]
MELPVGLATPVLCCDLDRLEDNLREMASATAAVGLSLRPHAKTHKCVEIAERQLALGAVGLTVATVGEAEVFAAAGVEDLFVAYPVWADEDRRLRLRRLAERTRLSVGVDSVGGAEALGRVGVPLSVLVEVDSGLHRSGVPPTGTRAVARAAIDAGLDVVGVFTFPGHAYAPGAAPQAATDEGRALGEAASLLAEDGLDVAVRSGGSTPSAHLADPTVVTEVRPGVYAFNDAQQLELGVVGPEDIALVAVATVVSRPSPDRFIVDAGSKILGADRAPWARGFGWLPAVPHATVVALAEHHGVVEVPAASPLRRPLVGEQLAVVPNHVCNAVNLVDELVITSRGEVLDRWRVAARGANT